MSIIFKAPARFDAAEVRSMRSDFDRLAASNGDVVIDLARTETLDGSGVGALVFTFKRLVANGNRLTVRNVSGQPLNVLNECGLLRSLGQEQSEGFLRTALRRLQPKAVVAPAHHAATAGLIQTAHNDPGIPERAKGAA